MKILSICLLVFLLSAVLAVGSPKQVMANVRTSLNGARNLKGHGGAGGAGGAGGPPQQQQQGNEIDIESMSKEDVAAYAFEMGYGTALLENGFDEDEIMYYLETGDTPYPLF